MAVGMFAGIAVSNFGVALEWYQKLLGAKPTFFPNDVEAVWQLAENRHVCIIQDANRAGGAVSMIWVDEPDRRGGQDRQARLGTGRRREARSSLEVRLPGLRRKRDRDWRRGLSIGIGAAAVN